MTGDYYDEPFVIYMMTDVKLDVKGRATARYKQSVLKHPIERDIENFVKKGVVTRQHDFFWVEKFYAIRCKVIRDDIFRIEVEFKLHADTTKFSKQEFRREINHSIKRANDEVSNPDLKRNNSQVKKAMKLIKKYTDCPLDGDWLYYLIYPQ